MARLSSRKEAEISVQELELAAEAASRYFDHWAREETRRLLRSELLIVPADWGYQVGRYSVKNRQSHWQVVNVFNEHVANFTSKRSAIAWCLASQTNRILHEQRIIAQDAKLMKLLQDRAHYAYNMQCAVRRKDGFAHDLYEARLLDTEQSIESARNDLEKTLNQTKYYKGIWE